MATSMEWPQEKERTWCCNPPAPHVKNVEDTERMPARLISTRVDVKGMKMTILNSYAPTNTSKSETAKAASIDPQTKQRKN